MGNNMVNIQVINSLLSFCHYSQILYNKEKGKNNRNIFLMSDLVQYIFWCSTYHSLVSNPSPHLGSRHLQIPLSHLHVVGFHNQVIYTYQCPLSMHTHFATLHVIGHRHANSPSTASGAGAPLIQSVTRSSSSTFQPSPTGLGISGLQSRLLLQIPAW